jgi:predicted dehydrogenase
MSRSISRRGLLKGSAAAGIGFWIAGRPAWAQETAPTTSPTEKLNVGFIGTAHQAEYDTNETMGSGLVNCVALCDIDSKYLGKAAAKYPKAQKYSDFRKLLEQKDIDAVVIAIPDHLHATATAAALRLGKHVYCEKPLTHTVHEARVVTELAAQYKRCTQMGTQIHAGSNYRRVVELVRAGVIGKIGEVHVWCGKSWSAGTFPTEAQPVPENINYDLWVGPAPFHDYNKAFLPELWRRYWAYGDGTLGDMACHYMDLPFWALDLGHATKVSADGPELIAECAPRALTVHWEFPARGELPPVKLTWYDGGRRPPMSKEWSLNPQWGDGVLFIGDKGMLFADYDQHHLLPEKDFKDFVRPPKTIPESVGHHKEWVMACLKNDPAATTCRFGYSGVLSEAVLLGNVAYRSGKSLEWDAVNQKITNAPEAESLLHYQYRKGWEL